MSQPTGEPSPGAEPERSPWATEQAELDLGVRSTGNGEVDHALSVLDDLATRPIHEHPLVFEQVHGALNDAMLRSEEPEASHTDSQVGEQTSP